MILETEIRELAAAHLADHRDPDILGFVDQLFNVAAERGAVACVFDGPNRLRFLVRHTQTSILAANGAAPTLELACVVEHPAARSILRMICARLGVICQEQTASEVSLYRGTAVVDYRGHWKVTFSNTPDRQEFLIESF